MATLLSAAPAWANGATPQLFGKETVRALAWITLPFACLGLAVGAALAALCVWPRFTQALDSTLLVFARGVIAVIAVVSSSGSLMTLTVVGMVLADWARIAGVVGVLCFTSLPVLTSLVLTGELAYAAKLYARVHRARGDGLARALSVGAGALAVLCGIGTVASALVGLAVFLSSLRIAESTQTLLWGLGGVIVSAALGLGGLAAALRGAVRSTAAVLGRGAAMTAAVALFAASATVAARAAQEAAGRSGAPLAGSDTWAAVLLLALSLLLLAAEFGIGAALHWRVAREQGRALGRWLAAVSLALACAFGLGAIAAFGLGVLVPILGV